MAAVDPAGAPSGGIALDLTGITKRYPAVLANDDISLVLRRGEVLGILGENGAGKSTLMKIVSGLASPDSGTIALGGHAVTFASPGEAIAAGIGMVHQHFKLVPTLSVVENIALGRPGSGLPLRAVARRVAELAAEAGWQIDPAARVGSLDIGGQQRVEILRALFRDAKVLILDEPTAVLSQEDAASLFSMVRTLTARGVAVILISHKLDDIFTICDRVMVLRQGKVAGEGRVAELDRAMLVRLMIGQDLPVPARDARPAGAEALIEVERLSLRRDSGAMAVREASFSLRQGEILALAGIEGNGQRELVEALAGLRSAESGAIRYHLPSPLGPRRGNRALQLRRAGLGHIPEDRHENGIVGAFDLAENFLLSHHHANHFRRSWLLDRRRARATVAAAISAFDIRAPGARARIGTLSGGNQQKLVLARELHDQPAVIIAAHPTRGLDVRTIAFVQQRLIEERARGAGVLLISADLSEIWQIADRIMVLAHGKLTGPVELGETSTAEIGAWMAGQ